MEIEIKRADITYLADIQNLNNQLFELEHNNFDSVLKIGWAFEEDGEKYFKDMFVLEKYRKYGIGTKLINAFKDYCSQNKIEELKVTASAKNKNAIGFYMKNGFNEFEIILKQKID